MIYYLFSLILFFLELIYFKIANHFNIVDKPNQRSSHNYTCIRGGGVIFYIGAVLYFLSYGFKYPFFAFGLSLIAVVSFIDDIKTISTKSRILLHLISILLMTYDCGLYSAPWYWTIVAIIVSTGIINAYNFMDGINGITGGYSLVVMATFWYINNYISPFIDNNLIYTISISLLVFNFFNFRNKAKCFAGDVGAITIAFVIVFIILKLIIHTKDFTYIIILLIYGIDSILTIVHRILLKDNIFEAHRKHMYQIMSNELHIPHIIVSSIYMFVQVLVMFGYFTFKTYHFWYLSICSVAISIVYLIYMKKYYKLHLKQSL